MGEDLCRLCFRVFFRIGGGGVRGKSWDGFKVVGMGRGLVCRVRCWLGRVGC